MNIWKRFLYHWLYCDEDENTSTSNCSERDYDTHYCVFHDLDCPETACSYDYNDDWLCTSSDDSISTEWDSCYSSWDD